MPDLNVPGVKSALSPGQFLLRGLAIGLIAGLLAFAVAYLVGEPQVERAIEIEEAGATDGHGHTHSHADDAEAAEGGVEITRGTQRTWGLLTGNLVVGVALGGIVALAGAFAIGRLGRLTPRQSTALVAAVGFVAVALVPFLKYPPNPPAVGSGDTIGARTAWYFEVLGISVLAAAAAVWLAVWLARRIGGVEASIAAGAAYVALMALIAVLMPTSNEVGTFPGDTLWYFRIASLFTLATLWGVIGLGLTVAVGRMADVAHADAERRALAASL